MWDIASRIRKFFPAQNPSSRTLSPFTKDLAFSNRHYGEIASREWALAYEETNAMFRVLNEYLTGMLTDKGFEAATAPEAYTFDRERLISNWSQRHFAKAAGLGTFGINNLLITKKGCCGRCGACFIRCPSGALMPKGYDRKKKPTLGAVKCAGNASPKCPAPLSDI